MTEWMLGASRTPVIVWAILERPGFNSFRIVHFTR